MFIITTLLPPLAIELKLGGGLSMGGAHEL